MYMLAIGQVVTKGVHLLLIEAIQDSSRLINSLVHVPGQCHAEPLWLHPLWFSWTLPIPVSALLSVQCTSEPEKQCVI